MTPEQGPAGSTVAGGAHEAKALAGQRYPDFFIVGHAKCGTTALYHMLRRHPQVFMPENKEPRYFAPELWSRYLDQAAPAAKRVLTREGYLELFAGARADQLIGEATTAYLRSHTAAARIAQARPDARIVAILREPADFLRSYHLQLVKSNAETERDLRKAVALEDERREGRSVPRGAHSPPALLYSEHVRYVQQLRRFHEAFPREQVLVLIYDDFRADNAATMREVLRFLGVDEMPPIESVETKKVKAVRSLWLHRLADEVRIAQRNPQRAGALARTLNALTPAALRGEGVRSLWRRAVYTAPPPVDQELMGELRRRFKPEVQAISEYLGRDLVREWGYEQIP
jgi:Sulfotransferase family